MFELISVKIAYFHISKVDIVYILTELRYNVSKKAITRNSLTTNYCFKYPMKSFRFAWRHLFDNSCFNFFDLLALILPNSAKRKYKQQKQKKLLHNFNQTLQPHISTMGGGGGLLKTTLLNNLETNCQFWAFWPIVEIYLEGCSML